MSQKANYFRLGMFIIVSVIIFVGIVLALSAGQLLSGTIRMETYFDESVQGLDIGSSVKYRGVQIGRVTFIGFSAPRYQGDVPWSKRKQYVLVEAELEPRQIGSPAPDPERLRNAVDRGLRVRIAALGITGTAYLEIDFLDPKANPPLDIAWTPANAYIPSAPSTYNQIVGGAQRFLAQLNEADIDRVISDIAALARTANVKLGELQLAPLLQEASTTLRDVRTAVARADQFFAAPELHATVRDLAAASASMRGALANPDWSTAPTKAAQAFDAVTLLAANKNLRDALTNLDRILARIDTLTAGADADVTTALYNLRRASDNLRDLTESAKRYPGTFFGEPPRPVTLPSK